MKDALTRQQAAALVALIDQELQEHRGQTEYYARKGVDYPVDLPLYGGYIARMQEQSHVLGEVRRTVAMMLDTDLEALSSAAVLHTAITAGTVQVGTRSAVERHQGRSDGMLQVLDLLRLLDA